MPINKHPTVCNICGAPVKLVNNALIYGRPFGSGKAYLCTGCGAYVGTHKPHPDEAFGILANADMRIWRHKCHTLFDELWETPSARSKAYAWLAEKLGIAKADCHFGYFDLPMLKRAYEVLCAEKS